MATKEFLQDRVNSFQDKISKSEKIIAKKADLIIRKKAQLAKLTDENEIYWMQCDINSLEDDIKTHQRNIEKEYRPSLEKYTAELNNVLAIKRDIPVLVEFLNNWKAQVTNFYTEQRNSQERKELKANRESALKDLRDWDNDSWRKVADRIITREEANKIHGDLHQIYEELHDKYINTYSFVVNLENKAFYNRTSFEEELEKLLSREWEVKYDDLLARMKEVVGTITDASYLSISPKGNIDGYVIGDKGKAEVRTIPAAGYNIQRFHYRTLVHKIA